MVTDGPETTLWCESTHLSRVLLLLREVGRGGAERQAVTLACALKARGWSVSVACFYSGGALASDLENAGVPLIDLDKRGRWDVIGFFLRFLRLLHREQPDILYSWLPVANLFAVFAKPFHFGFRVIWGVRNSNVNFVRYDWTHRLSYGLERRCVRWADMVIANSQSGAKLRIARGFPGNTMRVIPNGIDAERFQFDAESRMRVRREWSIPEDATVVGMVGRLDPMKGHSTFLVAAAQLAERDPGWHFVCVGEGSEIYLAELAKQAHSLGLSKRLVWVGARDDMAAVYSAIDIVASSSYGEGFANVIAEAMACGCPCVVSDVGDSAAIVGDVGVVVSPRSQDALADGVEQLCEQLKKSGDRNALAEACRARIIAEFSVNTLVQRTEQAFIAACATGAVDENRSLP